MGIIRNIKVENGVWGRVLFILWGVIVFGMAFYIPVFDYGFDGVVLWLFYSIFLLFVFGGLTLFVKQRLNKVDKDDRLDNSPKERS
jgi:Ca2+/Na+ antiporter